MTVSSWCGQAQVEDHPGSTLTQPEWQGGRKWVSFTQVLLSYRGYLIAAPSVFRSGVEEVISVTIFNSPRDVMVQAQLVAQGEAVARSQGAILGRSLGCFLRLSLRSGLYCLARAQAVRALLCFSPTPPPSRGGRAGCLFPIFQTGRVRPGRGSHLPCLGNQSPLFLGSPGSVGAVADGVGNPSVSALARGGAWTQGESQDHFRPFVELLAPLWC